MTFTVVLWCLRLRAPTPICPIQQGPPASFYLWPPCSCSCYVSSEVYIFQSHSWGAQRYLWSSSEKNTDFHLGQNQRQNPGKGPGDKLGTPAMPPWSPCSPHPPCLLRTQACLTPNHFVKRGFVSYPLTFFFSYHPWLCHFWIKSHDFMK